jgi:type IV secretion system protein VirD4
LTNVLALFGSSKDGAFNQEISDLVGQVRVTRRTWQTGAMAGRTFSGDDIAILRPEEIRRLKERRALVLAENCKPIIARMARCIDGKAGRWLVAEQRQLRTRLTEKRPGLPTAEDRATAPSPRREIGGLRLIRSLTCDRRCRAWAQLERAHSAVP